MISEKYVKGIPDIDRKINDSVVFPDVGIWYPSAPRMFEDIDEYLEWYTS